MWNRFLGWVEKHRKLVIFLISIIIIFCIMLGIRTYNLSKKGNISEQPSEQETLSSSIIIQPTEGTTQPKPSYDSSLDETTKKEEVTTEEDETLLEVKPNFDVSCKIWKYVNIPDINNDGSSYKKFFNSISL